MEFHPGCQNKTYGDPRWIRLHSGACNNLTPGRQHWGLMGMAMARLQPADYAGKYLMKSSPMYNILKVPKGPTWTF